jgi:hypothetical protein
LPGRFSGRSWRAPRHLRLRRAARLARAGRQDGAPDDRLGHRTVVIQPVLERRAHHRVHRRCHLGVVHRSLVCPWKLRLLNEQAQTPRAPRGCPRPPA